MSVTILVHITYRKVTNPDTGDETIHKESHFWITDDKNHDTLFVQYYLQEHWNYLQAEGVTPRMYIVWTDGPSSQFKNNRMLYFVARYPGITNGCHMRWNSSGQPTVKVQF
jgi:hypothetical protein